MQKQQRQARIKVLALQLKLKLLIGDDYSVVPGIDAARLFRPTLRVGDDLWRRGIQPEVISGRSLVAQTDVSFFAVTRFQELGLLKQDGILPTLVESDSIYDFFFVSSNLQTCYNVESGEHEDEWEIFSAPTEPEFVDQLQEFLAGDTAR